MHRFRYYWIGYFIILIGVVVVMYTPTEAKSEKQTDADPTVFVHGYKGTFNSFGNMLDRFENKYHWGNKALVYQISKNGTIHVKNMHADGRKPEFIQVVFEQNRGSFDDSVAYLSKALQHMKENYQIDSINLVGHSMGGIISLKFIKEYLNESDDFPIVQKYVAIGSPFNGIYQESYFDVNQDAGAHDLMPDSEAIQALYANENMFPKDIDVLSIASTGDVVAVPESVSGIKNIIPSGQLKTVLIENQYLGHSDLHESEKVDELVHTFLYVNQ
ncbi:MAG TPA: alpha/beta hydrolase [Virgibacillus sp.]|nr:alpha/beta hydrolase [Virgibacillus sp.]